MKNEWSYSACQYRSAEGADDRVAAAATGAVFPVVSPPPAHSYNNNSNMGHQPYHHHHHHHHHRHQGHSDLYQQGGSGGGARLEGGVTGPPFRGALLLPHHVDFHCGCACSVPPGDRTILHGILTGRGYKFGYGTACEPQLFSHHTFDQDDIFLGLQHIETKDHSPEVTSHSKFTTPPQDK